MNSLQFLLNLQNIQEKTSFLPHPQLQLFKQEQPISTPFSALPLILPTPYAPLQADMNKSASYFPPINKLLQSQPSLMQGINQVQSGSSKSDNIIQCLEQAAEAHTKQQKHFLQEITNQHEHMIQVIDQFAEDKERLEKKVKDLERLVEEKLKSSHESPSSKELPKKIRRRTEEINRGFTCPYDDCQKKYGSEISLNLHIKLKHNGGNKTEREQLAKKVLEAKLSNQSPPDLGIKFPPGFLSLFEQQMVKEQQFNARKFSDISTADYQSQ